jgi:hypothetical protein
MPPSTFSDTSADGTRIAAYRWDPAGEPLGAVQLTHGMGEGSWPGLVGSPAAPAPDNALAPTQRQEEPPRCNIVAVLCASMLHRAGYAKRDQPP